MSDKYPGGFVTANAPAGFSVAFDGTGDYLSTSTNAAFAFGTGNFTIEAWVYVNAQASFQNFVDTRTGQASSATGVYFGVNSGALTLVFYKTGATLTSTSSITAATWTHVALVRSGTTVTIYINGVASGTVTDSTNFTDNSFYAGNSLAGYMSNVRINKGTAVYTANFTPPTQMFPISGTSILTCQSPTIIDNSTNNFTITVNGNATVSNFTPFAAYQGFNPALGAAAGGVWTLDEAAYYQNNRQWPIYDPYFKNTTLMLHGNGTNGAQNNTFLDSSTNNFTITRNGNTTQGTFTPFSQTGWSTFFASASSQSLTAPNNNAFKFSGQFTIELWVNPVAVNARIDMVCTPTSASSSTGVYFYIGSSGNPTFDQGGGNIVTSTATVAANTWTHLALTRNSSNLCTIWVNGVATGTATSTINFSDGNLYIGTENAATAYFNGYMSNVRILNGSALYTGNFTPSTQPLTAIPYTVLLTCQSNRFVDNSANNFTITPVNSPTVQAFSPFVPAYITPTTYSNWFNGSTGYFTTPNSSAFAFGTGDFTVEFWMASTDTAGGAGQVTGGTTGYWQVGLSGSQIVWQNSRDTNNLILLNIASYLNNSFNHFAFVRSGTTMTLYINGVSSATATDTTNYNGTAGSLLIGQASDGNYFAGCLSNYRIVKGTAVYTANFTPPTAPLTAISGTSLLTCQSSTFIDNSTNAATLTANGNVRPVDSPAPFPAKVDTTTLNSAYSTSLIGGSGSFDGTGDSLILASNSAFNLSTGDFTIDGWVWFNQTADQGGGGQCFIAGTTAAYPVIYISTNGGTTLSFAQNSTVIVSGTIQKKAWNHIAVARSGSSIRFFVNGALAQTATYSTAIDFGGVYVGVQSIGGVIGYLDGYMSGLRIIKGTCLYTQSFAPPLTPPTAVTNTQLLTNFTNAAIFDNTAKNVLETVGNAQISTTQSKWGGSSMYFDGTGDWLNAGKNEMFSIGSAEDFTFEAWIYAASVSDVSVFGIGSSTVFAYRILSGSPYIYVQTTGGLLNAGTITANTWTHIAISRSSGTMRSFLNGIQAASVANTGSFSASAGTGAGVYVGAANLAGASTPGYVFNGYIDDLRFTKGVARYVTNFTPPTSQLQDQ